MTTYKTNNTSMQNEIRHRINMFDNYEVSSLGRVRSLDRFRSFNGRRGKTKSPVKGKIIEGWDKRHGYNCVYLCNGKRNVFMVHRLVAQAFLGLDINNSKVQVGHRDNNTSNNCVDNLYLTDHIENEKYKYECGRTTYGERCGTSKLKHNQVVDIILKYKGGTRICELEKEYSSKGISDIVHGRNWRHISNLYK